MSEWWVEGVDCTAAISPSLKWVYSKPKIELTSSGSSGDAVEKFIDKRGAVELLCAIDPSGSRFEQLEQRVAISRATVSRRLDEAEDADVVKAVEDGDGYALTETGATLRVFLDQHGATEKHRQLKRLRREFEQEVEALRAWIAENEEELASPLEVDDARRLLQRYDDRTENP